MGYMCASGDRDNSPTEFDASRHGSWVRGDMKDPKELNNCGPASMKSSTFDARRVMLKAQVVIFRKQKVTN